MQLGKLQKTKPQQARRTQDHDDQEEHQDHNIQKEHKTRMIRKNIKTMTIKKALIGHGRCNN